METCGYFDERFFCYGEETEWCLRLREFGMLCAYCADSTITHKGQRSDRNANATYYRYRNGFLLLERFNGKVKRAEARKHLYQAAVVAEMARRNGRYREWMSIAQAVHDGLLGQFGKRPDRSPTIIPSLRLSWLSLTAHIHDKWQSLRGNQPGFGRLIY
jgi:GT2 family glycosyltransferase